MSDDILLSLATDDQIVEELRQRHEAFLLVRLGGDKTGFERQNARYSWSGGAIQAIGMAHAAADAAQRVLIRDSE